MKEYMRNDGKQLIILLHGPMLAIVLHELFSQQRHLLGNEGNLLTNSTGKLYIGEVLQREAGER